MFMKSINIRIKDFIFKQKCIPWRLGHLFARAREHEFEKMIADLPRGEAMALQASKMLGVFGMDNALIGKWTYVDGQRARIYLFSKDDKVEIGKFCSIADGVKILSGGEHGHLLRVANYPMRAYFLNIRPYPDALNNGPVIIGNDVWIGSHAIVLSGINIGDGAVVGAGAVVSKDIPPYGIAVGNPARIVKYRFSEDIIQKLLAIKWWDWEDEKIASSIDDFYGDIQTFVDKHYNRQI
jgi:acetyltransferase-like isoleucine patch superfamily enzyme